MALVEIGKCIPVHTRDHYEAKRKIEYAKFDSSREYIRDGMIRCKKCHMPKVADFPEYNFVIKCCCKCEQDAWERARNGMSPVRRMKETQIRAGDFNPFD